MYTVVAHIILYNCRPEKGNKLLMHTISYAVTAIMLVIAMTMMATSDDSNNNDNAIHMLKQKTTVAQEMKKRKCQIK